jgi:hypothetical protein
MQESACRLFGDARVSISGASDYAFKQPQDTSHGGGAIESRDNVDLRSAGIREADIDASVEQSSDQRICTVHACGRFQAGVVAVSKWRFNTEASFSYWVVSMPR